MDPFYPPFNRLVIISNITESLRLKKKNYWYDQFCAIIFQEIFLKKINRGKKNYNRSL